MLSKKLKRILKTSPATKELIGFLEDVDTKLNGETSSSGNTGQSTVFEPNAIYFSITPNVKLIIDTDVDDGVSVYKNHLDVNRVIDLSNNIYIFSYMFCL